MSLHRKAFNVGNSLTVTIPTDLAKMHDIEEGSIIEFQPMEKGVFKLISHAQTCQIRNTRTGETRHFPRIDGRCIPPKGYEVIEPRL